MEKKRKNGEKDGELLEGDTFRVTMMRLKMSCFKLRYRQF